MSKPSKIKYDDIPLGSTERGWHQISTFLGCPKEFQLAKVRNVFSPKRQTPDYFAVGTIMHALKAHWFGNEFRTDEEFIASAARVAENCAVQHKLPVTLKAEQQALAYFQEYILHWSMRPRPKVIATEYLLNSTALQPGDPLWAFRSARLDDVSVWAEVGDRLCIGETKTTSGTIADCIKQYTLHGQLALQMALWRASPEGEAKHGKAAGVMLDVIQKGYSGSPSKFARQLITVSDRTTEWFLKNLRLSLQAVATIDWNTDTRRNITMCTRKIGRATVSCDYQKLCSHGRSASVEYLYGEQAQSLLTWRPTAEHQVPPWD